MYQKTHHRLAFFFAGITSLILIGLSLIFQYLSEKEVKNNSFPAFAGEVSTLLSNLESQKTITYEWLLKMNPDNKYIIALYDNGIPLSYTATMLSEENQLLVQETVQENADRIASLPPSTYFSSTHTEFEYSASDKNNYYVCYSNISRFSGTLSTVILFSTKNMEMQFVRQRFRLFFLNLAGIAAIVLFSYFYTGYLLRPIRESQEQQTSFIAAASHELRTPVSVILSAISALRCAKPQEQERFFSTIESEGNRMTRLIEDLLTLVRSDSHTWSFRIEQAELDTLVMNAYEAYQPIAAQKQIGLFLELPDQSFPPCRCDSERITQVLQILLSNAVSYSGEKSRIVIRLSLTHSEFCLRVEDHGTGISPEAKKHIFERFYREDRSRFGKNHFGLGLGIAKEIMNAHHGRILVTDTPGGGTTFTLLLPK